MNINMFSLCSPLFETFGSDQKPISVKITECGKRKFDLILLKTWLQLGLHLQKWKIYLAGT